MVTNQSVPIVDRNMIHWFNQACLEVEAVFYVWNQAHLIQQEQVQVQEDQVSEWKPQDLEVQINTNLLKACTQ